MILTNLSRVNLFDFDNESHCHHVELLCYGLIFWSSSLCMFAAKHSIFETLPQRCIESPTSTGHIMWLKLAFGIPTLIHEAGSFSC